MVRAIHDGAPPRLVRQEPLESLTQPFVDVCARDETEFAFELRAINSVATIVCRAVTHVGDQRVAGATLGGRRTREAFAQRAIACKSRIADGAQLADEIDVGAFG